MHAKLTDRAHGKTKDGCVEMAYFEQYVRKASKCTANGEIQLFWFFSYTTLNFVATEPADRQAYKLIWTLIRPKSIVPAASLALSQRTTNNLDEASIKAKHPQTFKYNPTFEVLCDDY